MKKSFSIYSIIWAICLAVFNVIVFVIPNEIAGVSKFSGSFWVGYIFITVAFLGQLACSFIAFKEKNLKKFFYNISLLSISYGGLIAMLIVGTACMAIPSLPNWIGIIVCLLVLAFTAITVIKASCAAMVVSKIDERVKTKTYFIKSLTADAEHLVSTAQTEEAKALSKKVYEAIRYSDPMSDAVLVEIEEKIQKAFSAFENAVNDGDIELTSATADDVIALIDTRNKKCKLLK